MPIEGGEGPNLPTEWLGATPMVHTARGSRRLLGNLASAQAAPPAGKLLPLAPRSAQSSAEVLGSRLMESTAMNASCGTSTCGRGGQE